MEVEGESVSAQQAKLCRRWRKLATATACIRRQMAVSHADGNAASTAIAKLAFLLSARSIASERSLNSEGELSFKVCGSAASCVVGPRFPFHGGEAGIRTPT